MRNEGALPYSNQSSQEEHLSRAMTPGEYEQLPPEEKEHFAKCAKCGEMFDRRSLDDVLFHCTDHKARPDIQYSGSKKLR